MLWVCLIAISDFKLAETDEESRLTISTFGQDFKELVSRLPQLNPKEGKRVTIKIITYFTENIAHKEEHLNFIQNYIYRLMDGFEMEKELHGKDCGEIHGNNCAEIRG